MTKIIEGLSIKETEPSRPGDSRGVYLPLKVSLVYLLGTLAVFLSGPYAAQVTNMPALLLFLAFAYGLFALGYRLSAVKARKFRYHSRPERTVTPFVVAVIVISSLWFLVFSIASLDEYGATGIGDVLASLANPTQGYFDKFDVYLEQEATGRVNLPIQVTVLTGALYFVLIPTVVYYWKNLGLFLRVLAISAVASYLVYFLFIGTQKGIGDIFIMLLASLAGAMSVRPIAWAKGGLRNRSFRLLAAVAVILTLGFVILMSNLQGQRAETAGIADRYEGNATITELFGSTFSTGVTVTVFYPTHGYLGLSKNLSVPFEFSGGAGVPAIASYLTQYFGLPSALDASYPARTEIATGWPAGMYWATIFPWLASDLTFPGAALFMGAVGWFLARMWIGARFERDPLALILFAVTAILIVYIPANNQVMTSRYTALGALALLFVYFVVRPAMVALRQDRPVRE